MAIEFNTGEEKIIVDFAHPVYKMGQKQRLYERAWGCEYPDCNEVRFRRLTIDHLTAKCLADEMGWGKKQTKSDSNCQLLCKDHHREKDRVTTEMLINLRINGGAIPVTEFLNLSESDKIS